MEQLKRLPNGYRQRVLDIKTRFNRIKDNFNRSGNQLNQNLHWVRATVDKNGKEIYTNVDCYEHKGKYYISFDYDIVNGEIEYNPSTDKYKLQSKCTVFVEGKDGETIGFVDNYKW